MASAAAHEVDAAALREEQVAPAAAEQRVRALAAYETVVARPAAQHVVAALADDDVVAAEPADHVVARRAAQDVTATATDSEGETSEATVTIHVGNTPPTVQIDPLPASGILYRNVPYQFTGTGQDLNEPLLTLPCSALEWQAARAGDQVAVTGGGCHPTLTFAATGQYTVTLTGTDPEGAKGTDPEGAKGTDTEVFFVIDPPAQSPPAVSISCRRRTRFWGRTRTGSCRAA